MSQASIFALFIARNAGDPMESLNTIEAIAGAGLRGDRYASGAGSWSKGKRVVPRHVSFVELETIEAICLSGLPLTPDLTRRNIVTRGISLNNLVGKTFRIGGGGPVFRGVELCDPCARPGKLSGNPALKANLETALEHRGGLRAEVLEGGTLTIGDIITID